MMVRLMSRHFSVVHSASSLTLADEILGNSPVTHIVVDYHLGIDSLYGTDVITTWRRRFPMISRVILLTGSRISTLDVPSDVDVVINKGGDPRYLVERLTEK